jgi:transcriptional regulator with XRE-family HTH domain
MPRKARFQARFGDNLREHRRQAGLSQERLAHVSGLHRTEISLLERGARDPRLSTIARLARALDTDAAALLSDSAPPGG